MTKSSATVELVTPSLSGANAAADPPAPTVHRNEHSSGTHLGSKTRREGQGTILLVEDDGAIRGVMREVLRQAGYQVFVAESQAQALEVWGRSGRQIDLLVTDVMIPYRTTGLELAKKLKAMKPELKVIYMSGFGREICDGDPSLIGASFLRKPFPLEVLVRTVADSLERVVLSSEAGQR